MKPKHYPYSGKKKEFTFKVIDSMIDDDSSVESIRNNRLAQIYGLEKDTMNEIDVLKKENEDLRRECEILQKILLDERRFFIQEFKHSVVENYRQTVQNNREHKKRVTECDSKKD